MEQLTKCNKCGLEWLVYVEEVVPASIAGLSKDFKKVEEPDFTCPACGSDDTTCI